MGTNYYLHRPKCRCCGRAPERLHIGKSSAGWVFALVIHPQENIVSLSDWKDIWSDPGNEIIDEYGKLKSPEDILQTITGRSHPNGLLRSPVDGQRCIGRGDETYDLHRGEFS